MPTTSEKQELIDVLKFTPTAVKLVISGYGGEVYAGTVPMPIYQFFKENKFDIEEYATDWDEVFNDKVPEDMQPFTPGNAYDCDNLYHACGAELCDASQILVETADTGEEIWCSSADEDSLLDANVNVENDCDVLLSQVLTTDTENVVFQGASGEKGCFFDGDIYLTAPFDPAKLTIGYDNCNGWKLISWVEYNGEKIDGNDGYSTTGKWSSNEWILANPDDEYTPVTVFSDE